MLICVHQLGHKHHCTWKCSFPSNNDDGLHVSFRTQYVPLRVWTNIILSGLGVVSALLPNLAKTNLAKTIFNMPDKTCHDYYRGLNPLFSTFRLGQMTQRADRLLWGSWMKVISLWLGLSKQLWLTKWNYYLLYKKKIKICKGTINYWILRDGSKGICGPIRTYFHSTFFYIYFYFSKYFSTQALSPKCARH